MIALVTGNSRFYYEGARELKRRGVEFLSLSPSDEIPGHVKVVLTSEEEKGVIDFPDVVTAKDISAAIGACLRISKGVGACERLIIGIDPGKKPGIAVLADGVIVEADRLKSPEEVLGAVDEALDAYPGGTVLIRVGKGGGIYKNRILKALQNLDAHIEMVDETSTTPDLKMASSPELKDIIAAVNIALKKGHSLKGTIELLPKQGEIKELQKESRKLSGNITISKELAERVAKGELSLEDAVKEHKNGNSRERKAPFHR
ncbi:MAG: hypothetical protein V3T58_08070 [Candidatus Hydrothermarchaeales archaeon]